MVGRHPVKFGGHRRFGSEDVKFLVIEWEDSRCCCFNPSLLLIRKKDGLKTQGISY